MHYLGGLHGAGVVTCGDETVARVDYDFDGFLTRPGEVAASGEIRMLPEALRDVFGRKNLQLLTDDGRRLSLLVSNYLVDALDQEEGIWRIRGNYHIDGQLRLISEGATLFTMPLTEVFFGGCGGTVVAPCTVNHSYVLFGSNIITLLGPDTPETIELVIDQLRVFGKLNDDRGTFSGAEYSGYWSTDAAILEVAYDYTPVSEVPLPGAAWLMLSAIACLGFMRRARGGDMRARHPAAACSRQ